MRNFSRVKGRNRFLKKHFYPSQSIFILYNELVFDSDCSTKDTMTKERKNGK